MINVTDIRVRLVNKEDNKLKAIVSITIDDCFVVHEIKVLVGGEKGVFVAMPRKKSPDGESKDIAHPIKTETRQALDAMILEAYQKALKDAEANQQA